MKREHQAEQLRAVRLRYCINTHFKDQGIRTPAAISTATNLPNAKAISLLSRERPNCQARPIERGPVARESSQ